MHKVKPSRFLDQFAKSEYAPHFPTTSQLNAQQQEKMHEILMQKHLSSVQQSFTAGSVNSGADLLGEPEDLTSESTIAATLVNVMNRSGPELCLGQLLAPIGDHRPRMICNASESASVQPWSHD